MSGETSSLTETIVKLGVAEFEAPQKLVAGAAKRVDTQSVIEVALVIDYTVMRA